MTAVFQNKIVSSLNATASHLAGQRGLYVLRINVRGTEQNPVIEVLLDGDRYIRVDDCETVSRDLSSAIDAGQLIKGNYRLDVMSPGLEEPLVHDWQFTRSIGRLVEVHYQDSGEHHTLHGHLRHANAKEIAIQPIHVATMSRRPHSKKDVTEDGTGEIIGDLTVELEEDEQIYDKPVELVKIERSHITKVIVQAEIGKG